MTNTNPAAPGTESTDLRPSSTPSTQTPRPAQWQRWARSKWVKVGYRVGMTAWHLYIHGPRHLAQDVEKIGTELIDTADAALEEGEHLGGDVARQLDRALNDVIAEL